MNEIEKASKSVGDDNEQFTEHLLERLHATRSATKRVAEQTAIKPAGAAPKQPPRQPPAPQAKPQPEARVQLPTLAQQRQATTTTDGALEEMNNAYAIIDNVGGRNGKAVIASWEPSSLDPTKQVLAFQSKESFLLRHSNRYVSRQVIDENGEPKTVKQPLGQWWLGHQHRRQYRSVTFMPAGPPIVNGCLNLWRGWGVEPTPGDWSLIREHIETVIANGDAEAADYVIRWIAWSIQNPNRQAEVALVLIGEKGAGCQHRFDFRLKAPI